jgi:hypothetical protein
VLAERGLELVVGTPRSVESGPVVVVGLGRTATEVLGDQAFRMLPLTAVDARETVLAACCAPPAVVLDAEVRFPP